MGKNIANPDVYSNVAPITPQFTLQVGPSAQFNRITDALNSIKGRTILGPVAINVADGTYNEPTLYFGDPELSGRLTITGNLALPGNCQINSLPDPNLSYRFKQKEIFGWSLYGVRQMGYGLDFSTISYGIFADNDFLLRMSGFKINGSLQSGTNVTVASVMALNGGKIFSADNSMILATGMTAMNASLRSEIYMRQCAVSGMTNVDLLADTRSLIVATDSSFTGPGNTFAGFSLTDPVAAKLLLNAASGLFTGKPFYIANKSRAYINGSTFSNYVNGGLIYELSHGYLNGSSFTNIADTNGCFQSLFLSTALAESCSFNNVALPYAGGNATIDLNNPVAASGLLNGLHSTGGSTINAIGSSTLFAGLATPYTPSQNAIKSNDGSIIVFS